MSNEETREFKPEFTMVTLNFRGPVGNSSLPASLKVPEGSIGDLYHSLDHLEVESIDPLGEFVRFGTTGLFGFILLDPRTGHVVESGRGMGGVRVVNTTLERFSLCVRGLIERYPFTMDEFGEGWEVAANELEGMVRRIDPEAYEVQDNYWYELKWSVASGELG
ncbi:SUKH-4 family immunity protein [Streptomyces sp. JV185]|uniref:SUKH-4 family immunity protein n=1 Tax=Streptomyces sp. JV185 TaxID=858638 RepID=UPI002E79A38A|nr:SUKH-4 family immunity protein [Streptomyces sp. JV185]MEE1767970.1 SUKH-4 family immunity protein [Streptomyces sp. JV185]